MEGEAVMIRRHQLFYYHVLNLFHMDTPCPVQRTVFSILPTIKPASVSEKPVCLCHLRIRRFNGIFNFL
jgi:hypothetical protein